MCDFIVHGGFYVDMRILITKNPNPNVNWKKKYVVATQRKAYYLIWNIYFIVRFPLKAT